MTVMTRLNKVKLALLLWHGFENDDNDSDDDHADGKDCGYGGCNHDAYADSANVHNV